MSLESRQTDSAYCPRCGARRVLDVAALRWLPCGCQRPRDAAAAALEPPGAADTAEWQDAASRGKIRGAE